MFWPWQACFAPPGGPVGGAAPATLVLACIAVVGLLVPPARAQRQMENLGRGLVALKKDSRTVYLSWRVLGLDPPDIGFNVYRSTDGGTPVKLNSSPLVTTSCYTDSGADTTRSNSYFVNPVIGGQEQEASRPFGLPANAPSTFWLTVPLQLPDGGTTPDGTNYTYSANDCSVGDLDGDGEYEIIVKWDPSNSKDNAQSGYTGKVLLDAYRLDGTRLCVLTWASTSAPAPTTPSSWFTTWTGTAKPRWRAKPRRERRMAWGRM